MKVKDVMKMLKEDGWYESRQKGSHIQFKHPLKKVWSRYLTTSYPMKLNAVHWQVL